MGRVPRSLDLSGREGLPVSAAALLPCRSAASRLPSTVEEQPACFVVTDSARQKLSVCQLSQAQSGSLYRLDVPALPG